MKFEIKKLYNTKLKKLLWIVLLLAILLSAIFVRTIPNYTTNKGYEIVSLFDYNKYKQGYCLKEDRILPKKELYKKVVSEYMQNQIAIENTFKIALCKKFGFSCYDEKIENYYLINDFNETNWYEYLTLNYDSKNYKYNFGKLQKISNPMEYIALNLKTNIAGFSKPILFINNAQKESDDISYSMFLQHSFNLQGTLYVKSISILNGK